MKWPDNLNPILNVLTIADTNSPPLRFENTTTPYVPLYGDCVKSISCLTGFITLTELAKFENGSQQTPYERGYDTESFTDGSWSRIEDCISM